MIKVFDNKKGKTVSCGDDLSMWLNACDYSPLSEEVVACLLEDGEVVLGSYVYDDISEDHVWLRNESVIPFYEECIGEWTGEGSMGGFYDEDLDVVAWSPLPKPPKWTKEQVEKSRLRAKKAFENL